MFRCRASRAENDSLAGWAIAIVHPLGVAAVAAYVVWVDRLQIPPEEAALAKRFPVAFPEHARRVRRWL